MGLIKDVLAVLCMIVAAVVLSIKIFGTPGIGIGFLFFYFVAQSTKERIKNKKSQNEESKSK